jgi:hypothetical protein
MRRVTQLRLDLERRARMDAGSIAGFGMLTALLFIAGIVFLIALAVAPIKLYGIHREIKASNVLLRRQCELLAKIEDHSRVQSGLMAAIANMPREPQRIQS